MEVEPKLYRAIMVSSAFMDLEAHRREVIDAIHRFGFQANVMEYSGARSGADVIDTSLRMVRDSAAYLYVIGHKYGQTPVDADRNLDGLSITELEFNEARKLGRPILLFLMGDQHPVTPGDVELDPKKRKKLEAFRKQAKRIDPSAPPERVYETFASENEFAKPAAIAGTVARSSRYARIESPCSSEANSIPRGVTRLVRTAGSFRRDRLWPRDNAREQAWKVRREAAPAPQVPKRLSSAQANARSLSIRTGLW